MYIETMTNEGKIGLNLKLELHHLVLSLDKKKHDMIKCLTSRQDALLVLWSAFRSVVDAVLRMNALCSSNTI